MFILENYFASKSFVAVLEAFSFVYLREEVPSKTGNRTSGHRKYLSVASAHRATNQLELRS